jgi:tetratricopeptide (TPR) repeat protein
MKWKAGIVEVALMLGLAVLFAGCEGLSVRKDLDRSVRLYEQGRLEAAEKRLLRTIETSPDEARLWHVLAVVHSGQGRLEEARDCHLKTIELEPEEPLWQVGLGIVSHNLGDPDAAEAAFQAALSIDPNCAPPLTTTRPVARRSGPGGRSAKPVQASDAGPARLSPRVGSAVGEEGGELAGMGEEFRTASFLRRQESSVFPMTSGASPLWGGMRLCQLPPPPPPL